VENSSSLPRIFSQEFDTLLASVASDAELEIDLAPGVDVSEVFDRSFRREGSKVFVPFGTFSAAQEKTVLMKLHVPSDKEGTQAVASVKLAYRDLVKQSDGSCGGDLAVRVVTDGSAQADLDPFVAARFERSKTAKALIEANQLFEQGKVDEARTRLREQRDELSRTGTIARREAKKISGPRPGRSVDEDFEGQIAALDKSESTFGDIATATPPMAGAGAASGAMPMATAAPSPNDLRSGRAQVRSNTESAVQLGF
jgi:Ca-activated chloride channel family protein